MSEQFPALKKAATKRVNLIGLTMVFPFLGVLAALYFFRSVPFAVLGFILGCTMTYAGCKAVYRLVPIVCPLCGSDLQENYAGATKYSDKGVEHTCTACSRRFVDYALVDSKG